MENSVRPKARPKNFGRKSAIKAAIAKIMGETDDRQSAMDRAGMLEALEAGEMGMMSDADLARLRRDLGMKSGEEVKKMEDGGAVTKKKGKSKKSGGAVCRGAGAAIKGTRFSGVR